MLWLRIIHINDVYQLDTFPSLLNLIRAAKSNNITNENDENDNGNDEKDVEEEEEEEHDDEQHQKEVGGRRKRRLSLSTGGQGKKPDKVVIVVAGDFLAPYLLSSLDNGTAMIDCLNALGVTHVCFGNHETDVSLDQLAMRIQESNFTWLNTNMTNIQPKLNNELRNNNNTNMREAVANTKKTMEMVMAASNDTDDDTDKRGDVVITPTHDIVTIVSSSSTANSNTNNNTNDEQSQQSQTTTTVNTTTINKKKKKKKKQKRVVVGFMGLLTNDASLYRPNSFGGAHIEPVIPCCEKFLQQQYNNDNKNDTNENDKNENNRVDLWIPITHQSIEHDREFAKHFIIGGGGGGGGVDGSSSSTDDKHHRHRHHFPIVLGGHDHEIIDETIDNKCRIIKAGQDATHAAITDVRWYDDGDDNDESRASPPSISVHFEPVNKYPQDPDMLSRINKHYSVVKELERATLFQVDTIIDQILLGGGGGGGGNYNNISNDDEPSSSSSTFTTFSTHNNRIGPSTGTSALCEMLRMGLRCDCTIMNAGSIRGNCVYPRGHHFTWSNLKDEIPFPTYMTVCRLPGCVIEECITNSRIDSMKQPIPIARGGYMHTCYQIQYSSSKRHILTIQNEPFDKDRLYLVALPTQFFQGIDNHTPLLNWATNTNFKYDYDSAYPAKLVIVQLISSLTWLQLGTFDEIDTNHDGVLTRDEVRRRLIELFGNDGVSDLVVDSIFDVADTNGSGTISPHEMIMIEYCARDSLHHIQKQPEALMEIAANVLGMKATSSLLSPLVDEEEAENIDNNDEKNEDDEALVDDDDDDDDVNNNNKMKMKDIVSQIRQRVTLLATDDGDDDNDKGQQQLDDSIFDDNQNNLGGNTNYNRNKTDTTEKNNNNKIIGCREDIMKVMGKLNRKDLLN